MGTDDILNMAGGPTQRKVTVDAQVIDLAAMAAELEKTRPTGWKSQQYREGKGPGQENG